MPMEEQRCVTIVPSPERMTSLHKPRPMSFGGSGPLGYLLRSAQQSIGSIAGRLLCWTNSPEEKTAGRLMILAPSASHGLPRNFFQRSRLNPAGESEGRSADRCAMREEAAPGFWALMFWQFHGLGEKTAGRFIGELLAARYGSPARELPPAMGDVLARLDTAEQSAPVTEESQP